MEYDKSKKESLMMKLEEEWTILEAELPKVTTFLEPHVTLQTCAANVNGVPSGV